MKNKKIIASLLATSAILSLSLSSVSASFDREDYKGQGSQMTTEEREKVQNMSDEERAEYKEEKMAERENMSENTDNMRKYAKNVNTEMKNQYKNTFSDKYNDALARMTDDQLESLITKIDELSVKINDGAYTYAQKDKYIPLLGALKLASIERIEGETIDINSLFE